MRKGIKEIVAVALTATMLVGCGGGASSGTASSGTATTETSASSETAVSNEVIGDHIVAAKDGVVDLSSGGVKFTLPDDLANGDYNIAGFVRVGYETMWGHIWLYDPNESLMTQISQPSIFDFYGFSADMTLDDYVASIVPEGTSEDTIEKYKSCQVEIGSNNAYRYYYTDAKKMGELLPDLLQSEEDRYQAILDVGVDQERLDSSLALQSRRDEYLAGIEFVELQLPKVQKAADIDTSAFGALTLQDLNGEKVKLSDVFAKNKLTMVDIWKTDCTVCVQEMPGLEELSKQYADQGFGVLSVCVDVVDDDGSIDDDLLYDAQDIVKTTGITYTTVLADKDFRSLIDVVSTPTVIWVDSEGNIVDGPQRGSYGKDGTAELIEKNLSKVQ